MKKYQLIKGYPNSPPLATVVQYDQYDGNWKYTKDKTLWGLMGTIPSDYPEFWQEVIEKDYEILSFIHTNCTIAHKDHNDEYNGLSIKSWKEHHMLEHSSFSIYSIKRLSDGEIFTIGDKIERVDTLNFEGILYQFKLDNSVLQVKNNHNFQSVSFSSIDVIKKAKQKLFTTEDGVDIFEDSKAWCVYPADFYMWEHTFSKKSLDNRKVFSTKEAAEEYIIQNKPCLSLRDVNELISNKNCRDYLYNIVKNKLNIS